MPCGYASMTAGVFTLSCTKLDWANILKGPSTAPRVTATGDSLGGGLVSLMHGRGLRKNVTIGRARLLCGASCALYARTHPGYPPVKHRGVQSQVPLAPGAGPVNRHRRGKYRARC